MSTKQHFLGFITIFALVTFGILFGSVSAQAWTGFNWTGAGDDTSYVNGDNWEITGGDTNPSYDFPLRGDEVTINNGGAADVYDGDQEWVGGQWIEIGNSGDGTLNIHGSPGTSGVYFFTLSMSAGRTYVGRNAGNAGTINQYDGELRTGASSGLRLGMDGGTGVYNLSGGKFEQENVNGDIFVGYNGDGSGEFNVSGGEMQSPVPITVGAGATGSFSVQGSQAAGIEVGGWDQGADGTLRMQVDDAGGITPIQVISDLNESGSDGNVSFADGALLDVGFLDGEVYDTWTVMTWDGTLSGEGSLDWATGVDTNVWSKNFVDTGNSGYLEVTAVPEPSSLFLLGIAGLLLMKRRRV